MTVVKFDGKIVQFGFGAVGKSFFEKVSGEVGFNENSYFVITKYKDEFTAYINLGGMAANFIECEVTQSNFRSVFAERLRSGDLLLDFADTVGTKDICDWCADNNIMYINTSDADWPEYWLNVFEQNNKLREIKKRHRDNPYTNKHPIVLQHGNNPGLVSHFVKAGIEYIADTQFKKNKLLKHLISQNRFNEASEELGIKMIHVNDIDLQKIKNNADGHTLTNTWCIDSFIFELLSEAAISIGTHENIDFADECKNIDTERGLLEFKKLSAEVRCRTCYPNGAFEGFLVPHDETVTISKSLEVKRGGKVIYRPSVMFIYAPCHSAVEYFRGAKVNEYPQPDPSKPADCDNEYGKTIIRGYMYPENYGIAYKENIASGTEYVGVLLLGESFDPVWVGNRVELSYLYKKDKNSYWQTPTITPVAMSALAAVCWMIRNKDEGGIYFPDDIADYKQIISTAEKYISKTIYKTFKKEALEKILRIDFSSLQAGDFILMSAAASAASPAAAAISATASVGGA